MKRVLCIGGPLDGHTVPDEQHVQFAAKAMTATAQGPKMIMGEADVEYTRRIISCDGQEAIAFYTAEGVGEYAAIVRVFTAYAKAK